MRQGLSLNRELHDSFSLDDWQAIPLPLPFHSWAVSHEPLITWWQLFLQSFVLGFLLNSLGYFLTDVSLKICSLASFCLSVLSPPSPSPKSLALGHGLCVPLSICMHSCLSVSEMELLHRSWHSPVTIIATVLSEKKNLLPLPWHQL